MYLMGILVLAGAYLMGNINGSILIARLIDHDDVRSHGSGNAGFTNYYRNYGGGGALLVLAIDALKAALSCILGGMLMAPFGLSTEGQMLGAIGCILGHNFPALLGFKGGKGIICSFVSAIVIDWRVALILLAVFAVFYLTTWYVSLSSVMGATALVVCSFFFFGDSVFMKVGFLLLALLAVFMHRQNIVRLMKGQEQKTNFFKKGRSK